jgi:hypothetical protein
LERNFSRGRKRKRKEVEVWKGLERFGKVWKGLEEFQEKEKQSWVATGEVAF